MNDDEARKVCAIMATADGGCNYCAYDLMAMFARTFPEHRNLAKQAYNDEFGGTLKDESIDE